MKSKGCLLLDFPNSECWCWSPLAHSSSSLPPPSAAALFIVRAPSSLASSSALGGLVWPVTCLTWLVLRLPLPYFILPSRHFLSPFPFVSFVMTLSRRAVLLLPFLNCCCCCISSSSAAERVLFVSNWVMPNENQISRNPAGNAGCPSCLLQTFCCFAAATRQMSTSLHFNTLATLAHVYSRLLQHCVNNFTCPQPSQLRGVNWKCHCNKLEINYDYSQT